MRAMLLRHPAPVTADASPLEMSEVPRPDPGPDELLVRVVVCGICRTDLDIVEGRILANEYPVIPGHQVVGYVERAGDQVRDIRIGERVGVAWIHWACGVCRWCRAGEENLCERFVSTGCAAPGGYAEALTVPPHSPCRCRAGSATSRSRRCSARVPLAGDRCD